MRGFIEVESCTGTILTIKIDQIVEFFGLGEKSSKERNANTYITLTVSYAEVKETYEEVKALILKSFER